MSEITNTEPKLRSPEPPYRYTRITRDPNIPVKFEGDKEPKEHSVVLTLDYPHLPGQPYYLQGPCIIELVGNESKLIDSPYHSVEVIESLPNSKGERVDEDFVESHRHTFFYILTRNIELTEEEKAKLDPKVKKAKPQPKEFNRDEWFKNHPEVVAYDEWFNREEENIKASKKIS